MIKASIVVVAHNEAAVIARCLEALAPSAHGDLEIVVVCNGCTDDTADIARTFEGVSVIELEQASKVAALNAGDRFATAFPRVYLDADIVLDAKAALATAEALAVGGPLAAAPRPVFDTDGASVVVATFYRAWQRSPFITENVIGNGVYGVSSEGRRRWAAFPNLTADDLYVSQQFSAAERLTLADHSFRIVTPRTIWGLIKVRTRVYAGNAQMAQHSRAEPSSNASVKALVRSTRSTRQLVDLAIYLAINSTAKIRASALRYVGRDGRWQRDDSSRS